MITSANIKERSTVSGEWGLYRVGMSGVKKIIREIHGQSVALVVYLDTKEKMTFVNMPMFWTEKIK